MSIASAITNAQQRIDNAYTAVSNKGGTLPVTQNLTNLPNAITSIPSGGTTPVINALNITPTISQQTYTASGGVDGYSPVTVGAVTASIDNNITAGNIKKDVTILGVTGTYEGSTGWQCIPMYQIVNGTAYKTSTTNTTLTGNEFTGLVTIGNNTFSSAFEDYPLYGTVDLSSIQTVGNGGLNYCFRGTKISGAIDLSSLTSVGQTGLGSTFYNCPNITSADISGLTSTIYNNAFNSTFRSCTSLTTVNFSGLVSISGDQAFMETFRGCTSLVSTNFNSLTTIIGGTVNNTLANTFQDCISLITMPFTTLESIVDSVFYNTFRGCTTLTTVSFTALNSITMTASTTSPFWAPFNGCTNLTDVYFPALTSTSFGNRTTQFDNLLGGTSNVTVHFPSNLQSVIGSWTGIQNGMGGTNTTVLFDLTATS